LDSTANTTLRRKFVGMDIVCWSTYFLGGIFGSKGADYLS